MIPPTLIAAGVAGVAFLGLLGSTAYYKNDRDTIQAEYTGYKATVKAMGEKAEAEKAAVIAKSQLENANVKVRLDAALVDINRLQLAASKARASRGYLPPVPAGANAADGRACFDRPKLAAALSAFGTGTAGLIGEGAIAVVTRDSWHQWFEAQAKVNPGK